MTPNKYQKEALRTDAMLKEKVTDVIIFDTDRYCNARRLEQGLMGLCGEAGEAIDILKKCLFQGHELNREHLAKELGDVAWYLAVSADALGYSLEQILQMNLDKLRARYPDGFEAEKSVNRAVEDV